MGNRAVILSKNDMLADGKINPNQIGGYLHWNGGRDRVSAFLKYCKLKGYRSPSTDCYGWACLCNVISNFFGDGMSLGIDIASRLDCDNYDNGVYIIDHWEIIERLYNHGTEQANYDVDSFVLELNERMPEQNRMDARVLKELLKAEEIPYQELTVGDVIWTQYLGDWVKLIVAEVQEHSGTIVCEVQEYSGMIVCKCPRGKNTNLYKPAFVLKVNFES